MKASNQPPIAANPAALVGDELWGLVPLGGNQNASAAASAAAFNCMQNLFGQVFNAQQETILKMAVGSRGRGLRKQGPT